MDEDGYGPGENPKYNWTAKASAEATAAYFAAGEDDLTPLRMTVDNPQIQAGLDRQAFALRRAVFDEVVPALVRALERDSAQTAQRMKALAAAAEMANEAEAVRASRLLAVMVGQLLTQGLNA